MSTHRTLHAPLSQQALSLAMAMLMTAGLLGSVLGIAANDQAALMANQASPASQSNQASLIAQPATAGISAGSQPLQAKAPAQRARRG